MDYDVIIIGAGPGGIFTAYEYLRLNKDARIAVFETGVRRAVFTVSGRC